MTTKRGNEYYLKRLEEEFPVDFERLQKGLYRTPAEAFRATGLKKTRSRIQELKNAWDKATAADREDFLHYAGLTRTTTSGPTASSRPIASDRRLNAWAIKRIEAIISKRNMKVGDVMREIGHNPLDPSLGRALHRGDRLQPQLIALLDKWITANAKI